MLDSFARFFVLCIFLSKKSFRNTIKVSDNLDPVKTQQNVEPDLDPNCWQKLSTSDKVRVNFGHSQINDSLPHFQISGNFFKLCFNLHHKVI